MTCAGFAGSLQVQPRFAEPIKAMIEDNPSFGYRICWVNTIRYLEVGGIFSIYFVIFFTRGCADSSFVFYRLGEAVLSLNIERNGDRVQPLKLLSKRFRRHYILLTNFAQVFINSRRCSSRSVRWYAASTLSLMLCARDRSARSREYPCSLHQSLKLDRNP